MYYIDKNTNRIKKYNSKVNPNSVHKSIIVDTFKEIKSYYENFYDTPFDVYELKDPTNKFGALYKKEIGKLVKLQKEISILNFKLKHLYPETLLQSKEFKEKERIYRNYMRNINSYGTTTLKYTINILDYIGKENIEVQEARQSLYGVISENLGKHEKFLKENSKEFSKTIIMIDRETEVIVNQFKELSLKYDAIYSKEDNILRHELYRKIARLRNLERKILNLSAYIYGTNCINAKEISISNFDNVDVKYNEWLNCCNYVIVFGNKFELISSILEHKNKCYILTDNGKMFPSKSKLIKIDSLPGERIYQGKVFNKI